MLQGVAEYPAFSYFRYFANSPSKSFVTYDPDPAGVIRYYNYSGY